MSQTSELDALERLAVQADSLHERLLDHLAEHPSPLLTHHAARVADVATAARRQAERVVRASERAREVAELKAEQAEERKYDAHTKAMAERMGITPDEFLELQETRRRGMRSAPGTVSYAPDHEVIR